MMLGVGKGLGKGKERVDWVRDWCLLLLIFFAREDFTKSSCSQGFPKEDLALHFLLLFVVSPDKKVSCAWGQGRGRDWT